MNLSKLVVPNVFVNVDLMRLISSKYDPKERTVYIANGDTLMLFRKVQICKVFQLLSSMDLKLTIVKNIKECIMITRDGGYPY